MYGIVLGIGVLTIVASPFVWIGACAAILGGSIGWGAAYGASFGIGRIAHYCFLSLSGIPDDPSRLAVRVVRSGRSPWMATLGVAGAVCIGALALASL
jgi:hypothetical protein